ncbi:MAG: LysR substrate-binding domain-containing protein [Gammaproteobacteria bacterium]
MSPSSRPFPASAGAGIDPGRSSSSVRSSPGIPAASDVSAPPGWKAEQRWTVTNITTAIRALASGLGFAWVPKRRIEKELAQGELLPLPLREGGLQLPSCIWFTATATVPDRRPAVWWICCWNRGR